VQFEWTTVRIALFGGLTALLLIGLVVILIHRNGSRRTRLVRTRLQCPVVGRSATVDFVVAVNDGEAYEDVARCSLLAPHRPVECGKVCRSTSVAPFAEGGARPRKA
jgi:hypothetical protein